jgi:hypothetical protein
MKVCFICVDCYQEGGLALGKSKSTLVADFSRLLGIGFSWFEALPYVICQDVNLSLSTIGQVEITGDIDTFGELVEATGGTAKEVYHLTMPSLYVDRYKWQ